MKSTDPKTLAACIAAVVATQQIQVQVADQQTLTDRAVAALVAAVVPSGTPGGRTPGGGSPSGGTPSGASTSGTKSGGSKTGNAHSGSTVGAPANTSGGSAAGARTTTGNSDDATGSGGQGGQGGQTPTVGAAEAAVTKAETALTTAEAELDAATMTAPIDGVVSALPLVKGDTASTSDEVVIIGKGSVKVVMDVTETAFRTLKVAMPATISTPGGGQATGKVTMRGLLPTQSSGSGATSTTATYPVTVLARGSDGAKLAAGDTASVKVTLDTRDNVVVAPVSAVTRDGSDASAGTVQVLQNGAVTRTRVSVGAVGAATIEITQGLTEGQTVVLADNTTALPTTSSTRLRTGGGAGGFGAGPPAGARPGGR